MLNFEEDEGFQLLFSGRDKDKPFELPQIKIKTLMHK